MFQYPMERMKKRLKHMVMLVILFILIATMFYHIIEGLNLIDSIYFSIITIATVGYGDFTPQTVAGKVFTSIYVLFGIGLLLHTITLFFKIKSTSYNKREIINLKAKLEKEEEENKEKAPKKKTKKKTKKKK